MPRLKDLRDNAALGAWLCQMARNEAATWGRKRRTAQSHLSTLTPPSPEPPAAAPDHPLEPDAVLAHLRTLPDAYRETLALRLIAGLTGPQIAAATGLTQGSVRVNLCRGLALLREKLALPPESATHPTPTLTQKEGSR